MPVLGQTMYPPTTVALGRRPGPASLAPDRTLLNATSGAEDSTGHTDLDGRAIFGLNSTPNGTWRVQADYTGSEHTTNDTGLFRLTDDSATPIRRQYVPVILLYFYLIYKVKYLYVP